MTGLPHFDADAVAAVGMAGAVEALRVGSIDPFDPSPRGHVPLRTGDDLLLMPAVSSSGMGVKVVTVLSENPARGLPLIHGFYLYLDRETGAPRATLDGSALTSLRTPAASAVATDILARTDVETLGIFGTGVQARGHVEAMLVVRPGLSEIVVCGRTNAAAEEFADSVEADGRVVRSGSAEDAAACDVVCCCTTSVEPVVPSAAVQAGAHLNLVGSYSTARREVDAELLNRVDVFVDHRQAAADEAGELILAAAESRWSFERIVGDLSDLVNGRAGRANNEVVTLFKSVGLATWDLLVAGLVVED